MLRSGIRRLAFVPCLASMLLVLAACGSPPRPDIGVTRLPPSQSLSCVRLLLRGQPVRAEQIPSPSGWRIDVQVPTSPPRGWVSKGSIVHDGTTLAWLPDGATFGVEDARARSAVTPALAACS